MWRLADGERRCGGIWLLMGSGSVSGNRGNAMKNWIIGLILVGLIATPVIGQAPTAQRTGIDITGQQGTFLLTINGSQVTLEPYTIVVPNGPNPPVPPVPPAPSDLTAKIVAEVAKIPANEARHGVALKLSKTYEMLAQQSIPPDKAVNAISTITRLALGTTDANTWQGVLTLVNGSIGNCISESACDAKLLEASQAISSTIPASDIGDGEQAAAELYGIDWDAFLSFLMQLLTMLLPLIIGILSLIHI